MKYFARLKESVLLLTFMCALFSSNIFAALNNVSQANAPMTSLDATGKSSPSTHTLIYSRTYHSTTTLPDGRILFLGGADGDGKIVITAEVYDPSTNRSDVLGITGLHPRAGHTATLLTDGRLLITGGWNESGQLAESEIWDYRNGRSERIPMDLSPTRAKHTAQLLPDGRILISGGEDKNGAPLNTATLFEPEQVRYVEIDTQAAAALVPSKKQLPELVASIPQNGGMDFPVDGIIALRFSKPLNVASINEITLSLIGPSGSTSLSVTAAENGMLAFITPRQQLFPGANYTLFIKGAVDQQGLSLPLSIVSFVTMSLGDDPSTHTTDASKGISESKSAAATSSEKIAATDIADKLKQVLQTEAASIPYDISDLLSWVPALKNHMGRWRKGGALPDIAKLKDAIASAQITDTTGTGVFGQVLTMDDKPLANVSVSIGKYQAKTNKHGMFLISGIPSGHQEIFIDGSSANQGNKQFGQFVFGVDVRAGEITELEHHLYMPRVTARDRIRIPSPMNKDAILTHPDIPGLELHVPKGAVIRDRSGKIVTELAIVPTPLDRAPYPTPENFPVYFMIMPGGAVVQGLTAQSSTGIKVVYPNTTDKPAGSIAEFWHYDAKQKGWYVYGSGKVSQDGKQVIPDNSVALYESMGASFTFGGGNPPPSPNPPCGGATGGDPVDCFTGVFEHTRTDVTISDLVPINLSRTYRPGDGYSRPFGYGTTHNYAMYLYSTTGYDYSQADLIMPNGAKIHFVRTSGTNFSDSVLEHRESPGVFYKAKLRSAVNPARWELTFKDGWVYEFSAYAGGNLIGMRDRYGNRLNVTRNGGLISRLSTQNGRYVDLTYDFSGRITQLKDIIGRIWAYEYTPEGYLSKATYPDSTFEAYTYDTAGRMLTVRDRRGNTMVTNQYDANGRVSKQTLANGGIYQFAYVTDANGKVTQTDVTDPLGRIRRVIFHATGYPASEAFAVGTPVQQTITYTRQAGTGLVTAVTDALNRKTAYTYDAAGNITSITQLSGTADAVTETLTYNTTFNQVTSYKNPLGHQTTFTYDSLGRMTQIKNPLGYITSFTFNSAGQVATLKNPLGHMVTLSYDLGDLREIKDPLNRKLVFFTDTLGRITSVTDALGNQTRLNYDSMDRVIKVIDPHGQNTTSTYDAHGNLLTLTNPGGGVTRFTYDALDRAISRTDALNKAETVTYDTVGNIVKYIDRKNQQALVVYDALNRHTKLTYADASTTTFTYDAADRMTQVVDSISGTITLGYDALDRLTQETSPEGSVSYTYDKADRRVSMTASGQAQVNYIYDNASRLTQITQGASSVALAYDTADRPTQLNLPNGISIGYAYDNAGQLTSILYKKGVTTLGDLAYGYDSGGRRTRMGGSFARIDLPNALTSATYDLNNRLTSWGGQARTFDSNGNLLTEGTKTYTWDSRDRLKEIRQGTSVIASYQYDAFGRRIKRTQGTSAVQYLYDGLNPIQEIRGTAKTNLLTGLQVDQYFSRTDAAGVTRYFLTDALQNTVALTDGTGAVQTQYTFEPYGDTLISGESTTNPFQYTGRENDGNGLYYYRARYYDPLTQRFIAEDPIGLEGGMNGYAYVEGNPISLVDPSGEVGLVGGLLGAAVEIGMQAYGNYSAGCDIFDPSNYDWWDVGVSAAVGAFAPGFLAVGKTAWKSGNAIRVLSSQSARTANRAAKLAGRIGAHKNNIKGVVGAQAAYQGAKIAAKAINGGGGNSCGCKK